MVWFTDYPTQRSLGHLVYRGTESAGSATGSGRTTIIEGE